MTTDTTAPGPIPSLDALLDELYDRPLSAKPRDADPIFDKIHRHYYEIWDSPEFHRKLAEHGRRRSEEARRIEDEAEAAIRTANPNPTVEQLVEQAASLPPGWEPIFREHPNLTAADLAMHFRRHAKFCRRAAEHRASWADDTSTALGEEGQHIRHVLRGPSPRSIPSSILHTENPAAMARLKAAQTLDL